jgi:hypothetical protein
MIGRILIAAALAVFPQTRTLTENYSIDLAGKPDARPGTWGGADSVASPLRFTPPAGYRVRILAIHGDFIAWPKAGTIPPGTSAEAGWGIKTTAPDGTTAAAYGYDNTAVWVQCGLTAALDNCARAYDREFPGGFDLGPDNTLISQAFIAINTSGVTVHMEPTFTIRYQFIPQ